MTASGKFNFAGSFDPGTGTWDIHGTPGSVKFDNIARYASLEIQIGVHNGEWRKASLPWNAAPLGGPVDLTHVPGHPELHPEISVVVNTVLKAWPKLVITSTYRPPPDTGWHNKYRACDLGTIPFDQGYQDRAGAWVAAQSWTKTLLEGIHHPLTGPAILSIKNGVQEVESRDVLGLRHVGRPREPHPPRRVGSLDIAHVVCYSCSAGREAPRAGPRTASSGPPA